MNTWLFKSVTDSITRLTRGSKADGVSLKADLETLTDPRWEKATTGNVKLSFDKNLTF